MGALISSSRSVSAVVEDIFSVSMTTIYNTSVSKTPYMEGDLSKKSIHINESFVHAIYIGIVVNSYSDIVAYI